jgi:hypothetical protein
MSSTTAHKRTFLEAVEKDCLTKNIGENGMPQYSDKGVGSDLMVLNQLVRGGNVAAQVKAILKRKDTDEITDLAILLFMTRNARGGKGEKKLSYDIYLQLWKEYPKTAARLLPLFVHYGYWKDLFLLMTEAKESHDFRYYESLRNAVMETAAAQLKKDMAILAQYKEKKDSDKQPAISLLAKWLPREGSSLDKMTNFVSDFTKAVWPADTDSMDLDAWQSGDKARYRRIVTELTSFLALPEVLLAAQREDEIEFSRVASKATMGLRKVFLNEDKQGKSRSENPKRVRLAERFIKHVVDKGLKGAMLMPHEIVGKIMKGGRMSKYEEMVLDAQWKDLRKSVEDQIKAKAAEDGEMAFNPTQMVPMADVSGSMSGTPMEVSIALSILLTEITHPAFRGLILTFHDRPTFHKLDPDASIADKVRSLMNADWGYSTNFEAAYDLILDVARKNKMAREDLPALIVFSDMQFNQASRSESGSMDVMHDVLRRRVEKVAKELGWEDTEPSPIVYWNLRNTGGHPVAKDTEGTVLLAGFSPSLLKMVMGGGALEETEVEVVQADGTVVTKKMRVTPEQILRQTLADSLYDPVRVVLATSDEVCLKSYRLAEPLEKMDSRLYKFI